jgi:hypothetical protein
MEDFHQRLAFASLSNLFKGQYGGIEQIKKYFFPLFPQWHDTLKENLLITAYPRDIRKVYKFQNISFPFYLSDIQILRSKIQENGKRKIRNAYKEMIIRSREWMNDFLNIVDQNDVEASPGIHCDMCPHILICMKGEFAVDRINE